MSKAKSKGGSATGQQKEPKPELNFRALMTHERNQVMERLQIGGELTTQAEQANELDWEHTILQAFTEAAEQARFDVSDPVVSRSLRRRLAIVASACEMWADQLERA